MALLDEVDAVCATATTAATTTTRSSTTSTASPLWAGRVRDGQRRVHPARPARTGGGRPKAGATAGARTGPAYDLPEPQARSGALRARRVDALRHRVRRAGGPPAGRRPAPVHARVGRRAPRARASSSSTTCWSWPARCCATPTHGPDGPRRPPPPLPPPAHRRVPGHRPHPGRAGRAHRRDRPTTARAGRRRRGTPSRPGRATCSSWATPSSRSTASAGPTSRCSCGPPTASAPASAAVSLTTNFRTGRSVVDVVNAVFGELIVGEQRRHRRPSRRTCRSCRCAPTPRSGPPVAVLGLEAHDDEPTAAELRRREAADVAARPCGAWRRRLVRRPRPPRHHDPTGNPPGSATSRSSSPRARRSPRWRTPSAPPASPTGPSPRRSCTPAAWSATCC